MDIVARTRGLRVCPACWSVVQPDDLAEHDRWHERLRDEAVAEVRSLFAGHALGS